MRELEVYLQSHFSLTSLIEIIILTFIIYELTSWLKGTQAEQVFRGLLLIVIVLFLCQFFGFTTLTFLLQNVITWIFILIFIVFQPELRSFLEVLGSSLKIKTLNLKPNIIEIETVINNIISATKDLQAEKVGALIICLAKTGLKDIEDNGTILNARVTPTLLTTIFNKESSLHDGAVIIDVDKNIIEAASCWLPLTNRKDLPYFFGTRHRAGIGVTEKSDANVIIVSEETGSITLVENGKYNYNISLEQLKQRLYDSYVVPLYKKSRFNTDKNNAINQSTVSENAKEK